MSSEKTLAMLKPAFFMVALCAVLSLVLAAVNRLTRPVIEARREREEMAAYREIADGYEILGGFEAAGDEDVESFCTISKGERKGYVLNILGTGYGGRFRLAACFTDSGKLIGAKMLENEETPGLGKKSEEDWYMPLFSQSDAIPAAISDLPPESQPLVSGASVTFSGVSRALAAGRRWVLERGI